MLMACAFGVPTLLCLWVYTLMYVRQNLFLLYLPLVLFSVILSVTVQSLGQSISRRSSGLPARSSDSQTRLLSWSVLLYATLCLGYRALFPGHFSGGLNLLVALLLVATEIMVCARFRPLQAGLTLALLTFVHSLPLLGGLRGHTLSSGPLLLGVVTELMLSTVLVLIYTGATYVASLCLIDLSNEKSCLKASTPKWPQQRLLFTFLSCIRLCGLSLDKHDARRKLPL